MTVPVQRLYRGCTGTVPKGVLSVPGLCRRGMSCGEASAREDAAAVCVAAVEAGASPASRLIFEVSSPTSAQYSTVLYCTVQYAVTI